MTCRGPGLALRESLREWRLGAVLPLLPLTYALGLHATGKGTRPEHWWVGGIIAVIAFAGRRGAMFIREAYPYVAVGIGYDLVRYLRAAWVRAEHVLGCGIRDVELSFFAVAPDVTLPDFFATHHAPAWDVFCAVPYFGFLYVALAHALYLYCRDRTRMRQFLWALALANYASFALWLVLPTAPPWYIQTHGCAVDLTTKSSAAGLLRVDAALGVGYFREFYSRAASVFGAMPSMHCAYPMLGLLTAWPSVTWKTRPLHLFYVLWMAAAAVYLDHHWVLDVLGGWTVAFVAVVVARWALNRAPSHEPTRRLASGPSAVPTRRSQADASPETGAGATM